MVFTKGHLGYPRQRNPWYSSYGPEAVSQIAEVLVRVVNPTDVAEGVYIKFVLDEELNVEKCNMATAETYCDLLQPLMTQFLGQPPPKPVLKAAWGAAAPNLVPERLLKQFVSEETDKLLMLWRYMVRYLEGNIDRFPRSAKVMRLKLAVEEAMLEAEQGGPDPIGEAADASHAPNSPGPSSSTNACATKDMDFGFGSWMDDVSDVSDNAVSVQSSPEHMQGNSDSTDEGSSTNEVVNLESSSEKVEDGKDATHSEHTYPVQPEAVAALVEAGSPPEPCLHRKTINENKTKSSCKKRPAQSKSAEAHGEEATSKRPRASESPEAHGEEDTTSKRPRASKSCSTTRIVFKRERGHEFYQLMKGKHSMVQITLRQLPEQACKEAMEQLQLLAEAGSDKSSLKEEKIKLIQAWREQKPDVAVASC